MMQERFRLSLTMVFACGSMLFLGCSGSTPKMPNPKCYPVTGKILVKGKPAKYAVISFIPTESEDGRLPAGAIADENGEFSLKTQKRIEGAEPGDYLITISWAIPNRPGADDPEYGKELLPPKFQNPKSSGLQFTVEPTDNEVPPFDLNP